jgi:hypothetical protein
MKLTQRLTMHLNGGSKFSELHYEVLADGQPTGITIYRRTSGAPKYKITDYEIHYGEESLDVLTAAKGAMLPWIEERATRALAAPARPEGEDDERAAGR